MPSKNSTYDVLLVGGGAIGLSLAWELSQHGAKVGLVDQGPLGQEASWAGAGMIPAGPCREFWAKSSPIEQLASLSQTLHAEWHDRLAEQTGIDNGYQQSGALYLAEGEADAKSLQQQSEDWQRQGIACQPLDAGQLAKFEPALAERAHRFAAAFFVPQESQLRNPRHVQALIAACQQQGVDLRPGVAVHGFQSSDDRIVSAQTSGGTIEAEQFCLTAGCWTGQLAASLGLDLPIKPIRGQMVLLNGPAGLLGRHVNVGKRYLLPRPDGRLLVGSTMEDVGFLKQNTATATAGLLSFAASLLPSTAELPIETSWSGLRPATADGLPFMGRIPKRKNGWIAAGHFRAGLQLSPATAVVMRALILGETPEVEVRLLGTSRR